MRRWTILPIALVFAGLAGAAEPNLALNGDLEAGAEGKPAQWSGVDGLTVTWVKQGNPGYCLIFNTAVTQAAKRANERGEPADGKIEAEQGQPGQYATVGAHEGVWVWSQPIAIGADDQYFIVEADLKGPRSSTIMYPQILLRGYQRVSEKEAGKHAAFFQTPHAGGPAYSEQFGKEQRDSVAGDYLMVWRGGLVCRLTGEDRWQRFRMAIKLPKTPRYRPDAMLLKPYAMWPLGKYYLDNVVFRRCDQAEYERVKKEGHSAEGF